MATVDMKGIVKTNILRSKHVTGISCPYVYCGLASESSTAFTPATNPNVDIKASAAPTAGSCDNATIVAPRAICIMLWSSNTRSRIYFESETQPRRTHVVTAPWRGATAAVALTGAPSRFSVSTVSAKHHNKPVASTPKAFLFLFLFYKVWYASAVSTR